MALKYDWDVVIPALEKAQNILSYAKGDCRNTRAMDFLDDCIDNMNTWIENAKPREEEPVINSRKAIKSDYHNKEIYREAFASLIKDSDAQDFDNGDYGIVHYPGFYRILVDGTYETEFSAETDEEAIQKFKDYFANKKKNINNSKKSIKSSVRDDFAKGLQMIMKHEGVEFSNGTLEDNMVDIYDNYISQFYEDELEEEGGVKVATDWFRNTYPDDEEGIFIHNSRKPIKSSLEDRLIPYLEEFEEGYADTINRDAEEGSYGAYEEAFIEGFKNDYNLTGEDIDKLRESVHEIWEASSTDSDEVRDMGEMYGVPRGASSEEALKHFE